ncbi:MAG: imidazole glycerol phosphate synthase subunit HisH [Daejeonella sp.]
MINIINYGLGNIKAFANIFKQLHVPFVIVSKEAEFQDVTKLVLPGVGAFDHAMNQLQKSGMREKLDEFVLEKSLPVIGVCVGMQMLANSSEEGQLPGLGWVDGVVKKIDETTLTSTTHLPHMGWNDIKVTKENKLLNGLENKSKFYFLHSYYFHCNNLDDSISTSTYGSEFTCAINVRNIYGVQFHPEKSHMYGIKLLENFANI